MNDRTKPKKTNWMETINNRLETISCGRCMGLLVADWCYDLENSGEYYVKVLRCVQCGDRIDPTIIKNHIRRPVSDDLKQASPARASMHEPV
jgi:hypothetical protein